MAPWGLRRLASEWWLYLKPSPLNYYSKHINCMEITLEEIATAPNSTRSQMFVGGHPFCDAIEDGYRDPKIPGETRIPGGRYEVVMRTHGRFFLEYHRRFGHEFALEIKDVPGFSDVLIHIGNSNKDTRGCLLVCYESGVEDLRKVILKEPKARPDFIGARSTEAYKALHDQIRLAFERGERVFISIFRREIIDEQNLPKG